MSELSETEGKILEAAKKVFSMYGYSGARMQQIADEAGISKASLHYYFRTKEKLFDVIFEEAMRELLPIISTWEEKSDNWEDKLKAFVPRMINYLKTKSLLFVIHEINRNPSLIKDRKKNQPKKNRFVEYFSGLQEQGIISKELNLNLLFMALHSLCSYPIINKQMFSLKQNLSDEEYDLLMEDYTQLAIHLLIQGIKTYKK